MTGCVISALELAERMCLW
jgi:hypothetical protein